MGRWNNYQDLEDNLSMPELLQTLKSISKKENDNREFLAGLKGIKLEETEKKDGPTFEEIRLRALGINASGNDIMSLQGQVAQEEGFGIGLGLGYSME